jgi:nicotinate phosphoribosyltransferase
MMQVVFHFFKDAEVEYVFRCRDSWINFSQCFEKISDEVAHFQKLKFTCEDIEYLRSTGYFKEDFLGFLLSEYSNDKGLCSFNTLAGDLRLLIKGKWLDTILYEVPILSIINESYFHLPRLEDQIAEWRKGQENLARDISFLKYIDQVVKFAEFGTRRRYSFKHQDYVIRTLLEQVPKSIVGTSNVLLAKKYGIKPVGTMAHEFIEAGQSLYEGDLRSSQKFMLSVWHTEYGIKLATALTDTLGTKTFIEDLDSEPNLMKIYNGFRQDSGCPFKWYNLISSFLKLKEKWPKTLVFSDSLNMEKAYQILSYVKSKEEGMPMPIILFGIGTHLTNNLVRKALNIVIKMVKCNGEPVAKISDDPGKSISSSPAYIKMLREKLNV